MPIQAQQAAEAGKVLMAIGDVKAVRKGQSVALAKGASIYSGDALITGIASNAQIRMSDGAIIALRAQTEFKIDEYNFNGKADGTEKAALSLVKGGVRAVTGAIGKGNEDKLKVNAVVATVGIRGTGFNLNYCNNNCVNPDKTLAKDGLYAGVFEGKITVQNEVAKDVLGVNEYLYVADKTATPKSLDVPPNFLPDPLAGQKTAKGKGRESGGTIPTLSNAVTPPSKAADAQVPTPSSPLAQVDGVVINVPPAIANAQTGNAVFPNNWYNKANQGDVSGFTSPSSYALFLQKAETWPNGPVGTDGLAPHSIDPVPKVGATPPYYNTFAVNQTTSGGFDYVNRIYLNGTSFQFLIGTGNAQQIEGGNIANVVSWGRWANGSVERIGDYNSGQPINLPSNSGFSYIVGNAIVNPTGPASVTFNLVGATTPTSIGGPSGWWVTGGQMTANLGATSGAISGNLNLFANQTGGYGNYNWAFAGASANSISNSVAGNVSRINGTLATCTSGCTGKGNVTFYGAGASPSNAVAAGLAYEISTSSGVVQGVAVYKKP